MNFLNHRYFSNLKHYSLRFFFNIPLTIFIISYLRYLYFAKVKKNFKLFYPIDNKAIFRNTKYTRFTIKNFLKNLIIFNSNKSLIPYWPLKALDFINPLKTKLLCIGPRVESEIFRYVSAGFQLKNISSIDIQTYSNLIKLGDAANMPFEDNSFDLVIIGRVLVYSNEPDKIIKECIRVLKNNGIISMHHTHNKNNPYSNFDLTSSDKVINLFGDNLNDVYLNYHPFDKENRLNSDKSNIILSIKK